MMQYNVQPTKRAPLFRDEDFAGAETASLDFVCHDPDSSTHVPKVTCKLLHDERNIYGIYTVHDQYVLAVQTHYLDSVCEDSCVEFFFKPDVGPGYFNLEMSANGTYLLYYVENPKRAKKGFEKYTQVPWEFGRLITVKTNLPRIVEPEISVPVTWQALFTIPLEALEPFAGKMPSLTGRTWTANFYKCGDKTSMPHWIAWAPLSATNFHAPAEFQPLHFL